MSNEANNLSRLVKPDGVQAHDIDRAQYQHKDAARVVSVQSHAGGRIFRESHQLPASFLLRAEKWIWPRSRQRLISKGLMTVLGIAATAGCTTNAHISRHDESAKAPRWDVAPQVVYRIDAHRFISLENYDRCYGDNYYNDTRLGIRTKIWIREVDPTSFRGRLIIDDPSGMNVVIPSAPATTCSNRGCTVTLIYSTDAGRTFRGMKYMNSFRPSEDSERYTIAVTKDAFYIVERMQYDAYIRKHPLVKGIDLNKPYPPGLHDQTSWASKKSLPANLRTPSGQERFTCDKSIRPANLPKQ